MKLLPRFRFFRQLNLPTAPGDALAGAAVGIKSRIQFNRYYLADVGEGAYRPNRPEPSPVTATRVFAGMSYCINNACTTVLISSDPLLPWQCS